MLGHPRPYSCAFYAEQPHTIAAVTGTNVKTSVAHFTRQIGRRSNAVVSVHWACRCHTGRRSPPDHPDPITLHTDLAELSRQGITHAVLEASSHGLDQRRMDGVRLKAAAFTNLSRDHFDYHGTIECYFAAKARLFADLPDDGVAVLNADVPECEALADMVQGRVLTCSRNGSDLIFAMPPPPVGAPTSC